MDGTLCPKTFLAFLPETEVVIHVPVLLRFAEDVNIVDVLEYLYFLVMLT